jgi:hypothetical protein
LFIFVANILRFKGEITHLTSSSIYSPRKNKNKKQEKLLRDTPEKMKNLELQGKKT